MNGSDLRREYEALHAEGTRLAGGLTDLAQRAMVYHHLFQASGGNHAFPLIAAHGALWAGRYFRFGMKLGWLLSWQYGWSPELRQRRLGQLAEFANAFRDVNRRVCVDTYANFHFTARHGDDPAAAEIVPADLLAALRRVHDARRAGQELSDAEKREVFLAHFLNEQQYIVGPAIDNAVAAFDWPVLRLIALKPLIRFAYFPRKQWLWFRNFARREERIENGLLAFDRACEVGWRRTEAALGDYAVLPPALLVDPARYFADFRAAFLAGGWAHP